ncbi:hypothetical protein AAVH_39676 [Aphelenchoides avenae]|nr:hypothetical protein AAVH_39676 [Aphelenchus avenae]
MMFSLLDRIAAHFDCKYEEITELLKEEKTKEFVEQLFQTRTCTVLLDGKVYRVHYAGLTDQPTNRIFCHVHGLTLDDEYRYNSDVELIHPDLPCVISDDPNGHRYYFPMEIIETGSLA